MKRIVELKERNYADAAAHADAPVNYEDAIENYKRILDITGDVAANIIAQNAEAVDQEGPHLIDHAVRGDCCRRCRFPEHLVTAVVHRHTL